MQQGKLYTSSKVNLIDYGIACLNREEGTVQELMKVLIVCPIGTIFNKICRCKAEKRKFRGSERSSSQINHDSF